jgi:TatD DNase family protein
MTGSSRVIAWGEIGLDYHYDNSPRDVQVKVFTRQLQLAREANLPVIIHTREAEAETIEILKSERPHGDLPGIMHCFSGSLLLAQQAVELGFYISFSGIVTFKKAEELRTIARQVPLDKLLIETDCPFLAPVPFRGKRNEPAYVVEVARCLAALHEKTIDEIAQITRRNFFKLFKLAI